MCHPQFCLFLKACAFLMVSQWACPRPTLDLPFVSDLSLWSCQASCPTMSQRSYFLVLTSQSAFIALLLSLYPFIFCPLLLDTILSESTRSFHCCFFCPSYCPPGFILLPRCFTSLPHSILRFFSIGQSSKLCQPIVSNFVDWTDRLIIIIQMSWQTDDHYCANVMVQKLRHYQFKQLFTFFVHPFRVLWSSARREENPQPSLPFCFLLRTSDELDCLIASREDRVSWFRNQTSWRVLLHVLRNTQEDSIPSDETHRSHTWVRAPPWPQIGLSCQLWRVLLVLTHRANVHWSPTMSPGLFSVQGSNSKRGHSRLWALSSALCFGVSEYHSSHPPLLPAAQLPVHAGRQPAPRFFVWTFASCQPLSGSLDFSFLPQNIALCNFL